MFVFCALYLVLEAALTRTVATVKKLVCAEENVRIAAGVSECVEA